MEKLILSDFFSTKSQANDFSERLSAIEANIYEVNFNLENELEDELGTKKKDKFMSLLRDNGISVKSNSQITKFFDQIRKTIKQLPSANLTLAIEPKDEILKAISDWFILNAKKQVLVEINVDPNIIAGAVIEFNGKREDMSVKSFYDTVCTSIFANKNSVKDNEQQVK